MYSRFKWILGKLAARQARKVREQFHRLTLDPQTVQRRRLFEQLKREAPTAFGSDFGFRHVSSLADFRRQVPILRYEQLVPYIERVKNGETEALFHRQKVLMFAMTSGTTSSRKFIPVTQRSLDDYRRGWTIWGLHMYETHRHLWFKTLLQIASDWQEFRTPAGIPCGSISGLTAQVQKYVVRKTYCLPPASAKIKDIQTKYYLAWRLGLVRDVGLMISANPSTLINLARFGEQHAAELVRDLHDGTTDSRFEIPPAVRAVERSRLKNHPARARELEAVLDRTGHLYPKDVWPSLGMLGNWMGGSMGAYLRHYPTYFGTPSIRDIGLVASEGRMTIPVENDTAGGILDVTTGFFEFIPIEERDSRQPTVLESHELQQDRDYFILMTTANGLYRYDIQDVVRCVGWRERTPMLAFLNKGAGFSNLTGEKLSEYQVASAVQETLSRVDMKLTCYSMAPCWDDHLPYYGIFIEEEEVASAEQATALAVELDRQLGRANIEYQSKRESSRLGPVRVCLLREGSWRKWDRERLAKSGGTAEQYKHPCLIPDTEFVHQMPVVEALAVAG